MEIVKFYTQYLYTLWHHINGHIIRKGLVFSLKCINWGLLIVGGHCSKKSMGTQVFEMIAISCYHCISIRKKCALISLFVVIDLASQSQSVVNVYPL